MSSELVQADVEGLVVVAISSRSWGIGKDDSVDFWLPKSQAEKFELVGGSSTYSPKIGAKLVSVEIPGWLADERGLRSY